VISMQLTGEKAMEWSLRQWQYGKNDDEWRQMTERMFAKPRSNYQFWDFQEAEVLEDYMKRFKRESDTCGTDLNFRRNWENASRAFQYAVKTLRPKYTNLQPGKYGLKEAIRKGAVVNNYGTFFGSDEVTMEILRKIKQENSDKADMARE